MAKKTKYYSSDTPCVVTGAMMVDLHHVKSRASGGKDEPHNLMPLIHRLHQELHTIGLNRFAQKYDRVREWLIAHEWYFCPVLLKWQHGKLSDPGPVEES